MELRHLRYFVAVVEHDGFGRAAEALHISQPPLSRQIRDLEDEIGVCLLERRHRGVTLTPAGEVFLLGSRTLLHELEQLVTRTAKVGRGALGTLRIGYSQSAANLMIDAVARFRGEHPGVEVELSEQNAAQQARALLQRKIDLALGYRLPPLARPDLQHVRLFSDRLRLAVPASLPAQHRFDPAALASLPLLFLPRAAAPDLHAQALAELERIRIRPTEVREVAAVRSVLALIGGGAGFGLIPDSIASQGARGVRFLSRPRITMRLDTYAFVHHGTPTTDAMLEILTQLLGTPQNPG